MEVLLLSGSDQFPLLPMLRGSPPKRDAKFLGAIFRVIKNASTPSTGEFIPTTFKQAIKPPDANFWKVAIDKKLRVHKENHTWDTVEYLHTKGHLVVVGFLISRVIQLHQRLKVV